MDYIQDKNFIKTEKLPTAEYENCTFKSCNFAQHNLSEFKFIKCDFIDCDLSLAQLNNTSLCDVKFMHCKLLALRFDSCKQFGLSLSFDHCQLSHASFYKLNIKKTVFKNSILSESDFTQADLSNVIFDDCDLSLVTFENTILEKADFRNAFNFVINPQVNKLKKARFSVNGLSGLLANYDLDIEM